MKTLLLALAALCFVAPATHAQEAYVLYRGATLIDGTGAAPVADASILVKGERIERVWAGRDLAYKLPAGSTVVDVSGQFVLPGLIDSHQHLATPPAREWALAQMRRDLYSGITATRDMADDLRNVADLARASRIGEIVGPDIYYAALMAGPSFFEDRRVHAASRGAKAGEVGWMQAITPESDLALAVAQARGLGASAIKVYANLPGETVAKITQAAHQQGTPIWAHAAVFPATPGQVLAAGVDGVSHVCMLAYEVSDPIPGQYHNRAAVEEGRFGAGVHPALARLYAKMAADGVVLDATLRIYEAMKGRPTKPYCSTELAARLTREAQAAGVIVAAGTDGHTPPEAAYPALHEELDLLVSAAGFTPMQAIVAATRNGALAVRKDPDFGTIEAGKLANLVFTARDPVADIGALRSVVTTVKRGVAYPRADYDPKADLAARRAAP